MSSQVIIRVDNDLKENFARLSRIEGKNASQVMREMMERYVKEHDFASHIDEVWNTISEKLKSRSITEKDMHNSIKKYRKEKRRKLNAGSN